MNQEENDTKEAKDVIRKFIKEYFTSDLTEEAVDKLRNFDFFDLWRKKDTNFGYPGIQYQPLCKFDGDRTKLANAIYYLVLTELPGKSKNEKLKFDEIVCGQGKGDTDSCLYSGDTLNTFATLFGYRSLTEDIFNDSKLYAEIKQFSEKYLTIGNFMPLPKKTINRKSINSYRGNNRWRDYYDVFLFEFDKCLRKENGYDKTLDSLIQENSFYFTDKMTIQEFIRKNFLEPYFNFDKNEIMPLFTEDFTKRLNYSSSERDPSSYKKFAHKYIKKSIAIIEYRTWRMTNILKFKLGLAPCISDDEVNLYLQDLQKKLNKD
jgi:hypothetical protein